MISVLNVIVMVSFFSMNWEPKNVQDNLETSMHDMPVEDYKAPKRGYSTQKNEPEAHYSTCLQANLKPWLYVRF